MPILDTDFLDIQGIHAAINRGDVCEYTTVQLAPVIHPVPTTLSWNVRRPWYQTGIHRRNRGVGYRLMVAVGASLMFVSIVGLGAIGGFLCLQVIVH